MLEIGGMTYFIDFSKLDEFITTMKSSTTNIEQEVVETLTYDKDGEVISKELVTRTLPLDKTIDGSKYEMIKYMVDIVVTYGEEDIDDTLGVQSLNSLPIAFKIAFNTLLYHKILKQIEL